MALVILIPTLALADYGSAMEERVTSKSPTIPVASISPG